MATHLRDLALGMLLVAIAALIACGPAPPADETTKSRSATSDLQKAFDPEKLCSALNDATLVGSRWKEGSTGFGCSTNELPIGPRKGSNSMTSAVWYEVRGGNPSIAETIVLGGDVRVPEADSAVRAKMTELTGKLLEKLNLRLDDDLRGAIEGNRVSERRTGPYVVRYASEMVGNVRENRLTIQRPL